MADSFVADIGFQHRVEGVPEGRIPRSVLSMTTLYTPSAILAGATAVPGDQEAAIDVSVVVPVYNEVASLPLLHQRLRRALQETGRSAEIIYVDDGSTDGSDRVLRELCAREPGVRVIQFRRNFGQTAAFSAGFDHARGEIVVTIDADLQNDPADIPRLLDRLDEGYDIVSGWRVKRQDPFLTRRLPSMVANWLISHLTGVRLHDYGCSLKAYRREVVKNIRLYGEMHRFIPAISSWMGVRVAEIPVNHAPRRHGRSKYGLWRMMKVFLDLIAVKFLLDYATRPIQVFGLLGTLCFGIGMAVTGYLAYIRLLYDQPLADRPLLLLGILLLVLGVQLITMGLLGELMVRTYHESQRKPTYAIRDVWASRLDDAGAAELEVSP